MAKTKTAKKRSRSRGRHRGVQSRRRYSTRAGGSAVPNVIPSNGRPDGGDRTRGPETCSCPGPRCGGNIQSLVCRTPPERFLAQKPPPATQRVGVTPGRGESPGPAPRPPADAPRHDHCPSSPVNCQPTIYAPNTSRSAPTSLKGCRQHPHTPPSVICCSVPTVAGRISSTSTRRRCPVLPPRLATPGSAGLTLLLAQLPYGAQGGLFRAALRGRWPHRSTVDDCHQPAGPAHYPGPRQACNRPCRPRALGRVYAP